LISRDDDNEESLKARLKVFHSQTKPVLNYYQGRRLVVIDASKSETEVFNDLVSVTKE
jgi:adenylate kinase